jgi:hypothetical protein
MVEKARATLLRFLSSRHATRAAIALGVVLVLPSLGTGLAADDWFHRLVLLGTHELGGVHHRPLDLFVFSNGDPAVGRAQQESGMLPWWADPSAAIAYFRPLSALTHWLDYRLWPELPWAMHAQNIAWFALALFVLGRLYRRFFSPPWLAALALLLYAVDDAHGFVISWVANRNALITLALGSCVVLLHDRARRDGDRAAALLAPLTFVVALLAGESAAAAGGYLLAYALFVDRAPARARALSIAPYAAGFVLWRVAYAALGYGTHGSGLAVDPVHDPLGFAHAVAERLPVLLLGQFALPPSDIWELYPALASWLQPLVYALAIGVLACLAWLLAGALRSEANARFWALGTLLAALPACSQVANDRLLLLAGVGAHALVATLLAPYIAAPIDTTRDRRPRRIAVACLAALHLGLGPIGLPIRSRGAADVTTMLSLADRTLPDGVHQRAHTLVAVNPPGDAFVGYIPMMRAASGRAQPAERLRWLATGASRATITRVDERTLRIALDDGFMSLASERMQRSADHPLRTGAKVDLSGMHVTVASETADHRPKEVLVRFDVPLEDPELTFVCWTRDGYAPFNVPAVGKSVILPAMNFLSLHIWKRPDDGARGG